MVPDGSQTYRGDRFIMYVNVESLRRTSETNIRLYVSYTSIKKKESPAYKSSRPSLLVNLSVSFHR